MAPSLVVTTLKLGVLFPEPSSLHLCRFLVSEAVAWRLQLHPWTSQKRKLSLGENRPSRVVGHAEDVCAVELHSGAVFMEGSDILDASIAEQVAYQRPLPRPSCPASRV